MLKAIALFEVRYQLRAPLFWISFILFFLLAFGAVTSEHLQIGARGNVNINSPHAILQTLSILNIFAIFVVTAFVSNIIIRDDENSFSPIIRTTLLGKFDYLLGRFTGALFVAAIVQLAVPLAMLIGSWMPWLDGEKLGPTIIWHYVYAMLVVSLPTLFATGAAFFALATLTKSMMWTYVGVLAALVLFIVSRILMRDPSYDQIGSLTDPFALSTLNNATKYWTAQDRNTQLPPLADALLYNRLFWIAIGFACIALTLVTFKFDSKTKKTAPDSPKLDLAPEPTFLASPESSKEVRWMQFRALTRFDMVYVFKSPAFFVLLAIGLFNSLGGLYSIVEVRGVGYLPVTRAVVDALNESFTFIPIVIAAYYGGDLVWRDYDRRIHDIVDATAAPNWAFFVPKVIAIALVILATLIVAVLFGMGFQLYHGFTALDPTAMLLWFVLPSFISAILLGVLSIFVQALVPHKAVGWAVMLVYVVASVTLGMLGFEHNLYNFGGTASVPLSDMNRMGHFWIGRAWHQAYWLAFGAILLVLTQALWRRGGDTRLGPRITRLVGQLKGSTGLVFATACIAWMSTGAWVFYNTNILNKYITQPQVEKRSAEMEKILRPFENKPIPTIKQVDLTVELFPKQSLAITRGSYALVNQTGQTIEQISLQFNPELSEIKVAIEGSKLVKDYPDFGFQIYQLAKPLPAGESLTIQFQTRLEQKGFVNNQPLTRVVENGTFLDNFTLAPVVGISTRGFLEDKSKRRKYGLPAAVRMAKLEDTSANAHHYLRHDSDWVNANIALTTDADQTPLAPGYTISDTVKGGRRTLVTRTEKPIQNFFSLQSAKYAVSKATWTGKAASPVELSVYYHPAHEKNVKRMLDAIGQSLDVFSAAFSPYQFTQLRVLEFPGYESFAQAFANTVPFSEAIGFVQNFDDSQKDSKIDLVTYITAHEVAHQWWAHQIIGADKQGSTMLSETFAQYSALLVMEKLYGKEQIRKFLKFELDNYLRSRSSETVEELPLNRVETQPYIYYRKGAVTMYWLKEVVGEAAVNNSLKKLLTEFAFKAAPYPSTTDFLRILRAEVDPKHEALIADSFEKITLFDLKAVSAKSTVRSDGQFDVQFIVDAKKLYADGKGKETDAALNEQFDIGVFTDEPGKVGYVPASVLAMQRRTLISGKQTLTFTVKKRPFFAGIDPYNMRIDRNSNDNLIKIE